MKKRILVVDDERNITRSIENQLDPALYTYDSLRNANNAYWFFKRNRESIDLVIIDLTMQGRTGNELAEKLRHMKPDIPIVLIAGILEADDQYSRNIEVIYKPVSDDDVLHALHDLTGTHKSDVSF